MKIGKIIKKIVAALFVIFFAALIVRIFLLSDSRTLSDIYPTSSAADAYATAGDDAFLTHKTADEISEDGYFGAYALCYSKISGELQITARYNDSLHNRYLMGSDPQKYKWELRDGDGSVLSHGTVLDTVEKYRYNYVRLAFYDVSIGKDTTVYLFLICDECEYPEKDTKGFAVHHPGQSFTTYKLSDAERSALKG